MIEKWLWELLPSSFKTSNKEPEDTDVYKLLKTWASVAEGFRQSAFSARRQKFPELSDDKVLYLLGKERNLEKFRYEGSDEFRERIRKSVDFWFQAGSVETLKEILTIYGFPGVEIKSVRREDPEKWAEFDVALERRTLIENVKERVELVTNVINHLKPAHEKLRYFQLNFIFETEHQIAASSNLSTFTKATFEEDSEKKILMSQDGEYKILGTGIKPVTFTTATFEENSEKVITAGDGVSIFAGNVTADGFLKASFESTETEWDFSSTCAVTGSFNSVAFIRINLTGGIN
ncbi:phage tail protein [Desulfurobacterium crinifex]